jgi:hypothetical protein
VVKHLRQKGIRILAYMDDFILMADTLSQAISHRKRFLSILHNLGWFISMKKSHLVPLHKQEFLGMQVDTISTPQYRISGKKLHNIKHEVSRLIKVSQQDKIPVRYLARIAGKCMAVTRAVLPARMFLRNVYKLIANAPTWNSRIYLNLAAVAELSWWRDSLTHWNGRTVINKPPEVVLETDASATGWEQFANRKQHQENGTSKCQPNPATQEN